MISYRRVLIALILTSLFACGGYKGPAVGDVEKKTFSPAHVETGYFMVCAGYGKYGCEAWIPVPYSHDIPDQWYLTLTACKEKGNPKSCQRESFEVTQATFNGVEIGDQLAYKDVKK